MHSLARASFLIACLGFIACAEAEQSDAGATSRGSGGSTSSSSGGDGAHGGAGGSASSTGGEGGEGGSFTGGGGEGGQGGQGGAGGQGGSMPVCGNGIPEPGEACDGAGVTCADLGFMGGAVPCTAACALDLSMCNGCGNGAIDAVLGEECDFDAQGDPLIATSCQALGYPQSGANPSCTPDCTYDVRVCKCGDGILDPWEDCDGADLGGSTCQTEGFGGGALACTPDCTFDTAACNPCGNGVIDAGEPCDGADLGAATCVSLGYGGGSLACLPGCFLDTTGCDPCGNGVINAGEQCDGASLGGQTCVTQGFGGGQIACNANCTFNTSACDPCGNSVIDAGEQCDGANLAGQTCVTQGFGGGQLACNANCSLNTAGCNLCGNGALDPGEQCDDNNQASGDGCSSTCQLEVMVCNPNGTYTIVGAPVNYTCCFGLVSVNVSSFLFSNSGATISSSPSNPVSMTGNATTCPGGSFNNTGTIPGGCAETYSLVGSFTSANTWTGTYQVSFSGPDCSCFGGLGTPCVNQLYSITATK